MFEMLCIKSYLQSPGFLQGFFYLISYSACDRQYKAFPIRKALIYSGGISNSINLRNFEKRKSSNFKGRQRTYQESDFESG